jgi:Amidase
MMQSGRARRWQRGCAIGSDTSGSVRIPAAFNGVVGDQHRAHRQGWSRSARADLRHDRAAGALGGGLRAAGHVAARAGRVARAARRLKLVDPGRADQRRDGRRRTGGNGTFSNWTNVPESSLTYAVGKKLRQRLARWQPRPASEDLFPRGPKYSRPRDLAQRSSGPALLPPKSSHLNELSRLTKPSGSPGDQLSG